ncbi:MAG: tRNA epoxyqueuosine(34) reductase QueG [Bacteroidetes bacterium]|nr:MAG: tRNA epoxyqueuosine(34) reductase QueG [Bacteroidota bacterium]
MSSLSASRNAALVKAKAAELGFQFCGISKADFLADEAPRLEAWLHAGHHGAMSYMANHFDLRLDPRKLVPGAKSVVSLLYNYYPSESPSDAEAPKVARYAYGRDYHKVIKKKLQELMHVLEQDIGAIEGRAFVDSAPVMERQWAAKAGLGWTGKNTLLINKGSGSWYFLAELIIDLELEPDGPVKDHCGTCTACIDACPTEAITPYSIAAEKCISYLTIELKDQIPAEFEGKLDNWVFGCDICQEVCPWNRFAQKHSEPDFHPKAFLNWSKSDWEELSETLFSEVFAGTPLKRAGFEKLKNSLAFGKEPRV